MLHTVTERGDQLGTGASQPRCMSGGTCAMVGKAQVKLTAAGAWRAAPHQQPPRGDHTQRCQSQEEQAAGTIRKNNKGE